MLGFRRLVTVLVIVSSLLVVMSVIDFELQNQRDIMKTLSTKIRSLQETSIARDKEILELKKELMEKEKQITNLEKLNSSLKENSERWLEHKSNISRGGDRSIKFRVTAYDLTYESCEKYSNDPEYGITYSGNYVKPYHTIAAGPEVPIGTRVYIPYFANWPNKGIFVVDDRGGGIKYRCIDIFNPDTKWVKEFGVKYLEVYILN